jgi:hypothetical protein
VCALTHDTMQRSGSPPTRLFIKARLARGQRHVAYETEAHWLCSQANAPLSHRQLGSGAKAGCPRCKGSRPWVKRCRVFFNTPALQRHREPLQGWCVVFKLLRDAQRRVGGAAAGEQGQAGPVQRIGVLFPVHENATTRLCRDWCERHGLLVTGGSDCFQKDGQLWQNTCVSWAGRWA